MCGIAGFYGATGMQADHRLVVERMVDSIRHRGPDSHGVYVDSGVGLGHARLSIIDLSPTGHQPMSNEDGSLWITFNGEIFNYIELRRELEAKGCRFRSTSDTETILHSYSEKGTDCVHDFNGDFGFALWDKRRDRLVLARDRMGVRPVYYTAQNGALVFASEVKALLQFPGVSAELDPIALDQCFTVWFPLAPRTPFERIKELPPGHILIADGPDITVKPYWQLDYPHFAEDRIPRPGEEEALAEELAALLIDATQIRLRADVPVGAYLSGGLDSSAITALIRTFSSNRMRTFSVGFESEEFDESAYQQEVVRALNTDHSSTLCTRADIGRSFPDVVRHMERPVLRTAPAPLYQLARLVRDNDFKVVLTGEGADEILAGYDIFKEAKIRRFWARKPDSAWRPLLLRKLYPYLSGVQSQSQAYLQAFFGMGLDAPDDPLFSHLPRFTMTARTKAFFSDDLRERIAGYDALDDLRGSLPESFRTWHPLNQAQYLEAAHLLPSYILSSQGDRVAMAHAVEGRFPFLDHRVAEFASRIPTRLKMKVLTEKNMLRKAVGKHLPEVIAKRPKQPYRAPDSQSFFGPQAPDYVEDVLSARSIADAGYFRPEAVARLVNKCRTQPFVSTSDNQALVGILSVQLLHNQFVSGSSRARVVASAR